MLIEESNSEGYCQLGEDCAALPLLDQDYAAYREAHRNRVGGNETGGES